MWIVVQEGVYRHNILGLYDSLGGAEDRAREASMTFSGGFSRNGEDDGYHTYEVMSLPINESIDDATPVSYFQKGTRFER